MLFQKTLSCLGLLASVASAAPSLRRRATSGGPLNVVYWGQNGGGTIENNDLSAYCTATSDIDVLVLSSLWQWSNGATAMGGSFGQSCGVTSSGQPQNCDALVAAITKCKNAGVKIILSIGGAAAYSSFASADEASAAGQYVWNAYGGGSGVTRPFGNNIVDGFDLDLEIATGNQYFIPFLNTLRSNFASDPNHSYVITGAPQCPLPEPNMSVIIQGVQFDYLWIQFYNNNNYTVPCSLGINGGAPFNYNNWTSYIASTPSKGAKLFVGVPAGPDAANGSPTGAVYYATPQQLAQIVAEVKGNSNFGGIMMWSAGFSDANTNNGCTYAQEAKNILLTGSPCSSGPITASLPPVPTSTSTSASSPPGSSSTPPSGSGSVPQWGQCGGDGYTGPTQCISPYKCVSTSEWWSQCE